MGGKNVGLRRRPRVRLNIPNDSAKSLDKPHKNSLSNAVLDRWEAWVVDPLKGDFMLQTTTLSRLQGFSDSDVISANVGLVGISEIRNVYLPIWQQAEDNDIWDNLGSLVFGEVRRRDRVSRFHRVVEGG